jgi:hypothetical protein
MKTISTLVAVLAADVVIASPTITPRKMIWPPSGNELSLTCVATYADGEYILIYLHEPMFLTISLSLKVQSMIMLYLMV